MDEKSNRKSRSAMRAEQRARLEEQRRKIEAKLDRVIQRERDDEKRKRTHRMIVLGGVLLADIELHPMTLDWVQDVLGRAAPHMRPHDRAAIMDLLRERDAKQFAIVSEPDESPQTGTSQVAE